MTQTTDSLAALLQQTARHDRAAFANLYLATNLKLFGIVLRILKRKALAEDILQDVYIKIWHGAVHFNATRGSAIAWMAAIARNCALDEVRRGARLVSSEEVAGFEDIPSLELRADERMERDGEYAKLNHCLNCMDEGKRQMLMLAYQNGMSREELAERFQQPVATVKTWLRRSLIALKACLESHE